MAIHPCHEGNPYNYDEVDQIRNDPWLMAEALKRMATRGIRFAGYASQPAWFGVNRQLIQIAGASETSVRVDPDRASAVAWLLHRGARPD